MVAPGGTTVVIWVLVAEITFPATELKLIPSALERLVPFRVTGSPTMSRVGCTEVNAGAGGGGGGGPSDFLLHCGIVNIQQISIISSGYLVEFFFIKSF